MNADRKQAEEILEKHFLPHEIIQYNIKMRIIDAMIEFSQLSSPLPEITEEIKKLRITQIAENAWENKKYKPLTLKMVDIDEVLNILSRLSERKEQKTTEQHIPTDEEMLRDAKEYAKEHSNAPDKDCPEWIIADYMAGAGNMRERLTGVIINRQQKGAPFDEEGTKNPEPIVKERCPFQATKRCLYACGTDDCRYHPNNL